MKLRYLSLLLLLALVFVPGDIVNAETIADGHEIESFDINNIQSFNDWQIEPTKEEFLIDEKGHVIKGVVYYSETNSRGVNHCLKYIVYSDGSSPLYITNSGTYATLFNYNNLSNNLLKTDRMVLFFGSDEFPSELSMYDPKYIYSIDDSIYATYPHNTLNISTNTFDSNGWNIISSNDGRKSFYTNIPIFQDKDGEALQNYINNGDYSGANNADDVDTIKKSIYPDNKYENEKGPWLKMGTFDGTNLTIRPADDANCSWTYEPQNTDIYTDLTLDVLYSYQISIEYVNDATIGQTQYFTASKSYSLSDYPLSFVCYPAEVCVDDGWFPRDYRSLMFGGKVNYSTGISMGFNFTNTSDIYEVTGSYLTVTMKLRGKCNGDWVHGGAAIEKVDLVNRTCTEQAAYSDEDGNYTVDETTPPVTKDENGNVVINNNVTGGGGGSSATGGNASVTIGDITTSSTFRFPDKITVDLNINGLDGTGGGGSSGASTEDGSKKWYDRLLDALSSLLEFLTGAVTKLFEALGDLLTTFADSVGDFIQYLFEGFGLFKKDGGIGSLIQENYSFVPSQVWSLVMFGIASVILVSIINRFFK